MITVMRGMANVGATPRMTHHDKEGFSFAVEKYGSHQRAELQRFYEGFEPKRGAQGLPPLDPEGVDRWLTSILSTGIHLLALREEQLIAHGLVMPTDREGVGEYAVFLRHDLRGRRIGTELNWAMVEAARQAGLHLLWLTVEPRNRSAIRSYEKVGFRFVPKTAFSVEPEMELVL